MSGTVKSGDSAGTWAWGSLGKGSVGHLMRFYVRASKRGNRI